MVGGRKSRILATEDDNPASIDPLTNSNLNRNPLGSINDQSRPVVSSSRGATKKSGSTRGVNNANSSSGTTANQM